MGVKLERLRNAPYELNFLEGVRPERYVWTASNGKHSQVREVSDDCYNYLLRASQCFKDGDLRVVEEGGSIADVENDIVDIELYKANSHSREEVEKLLKGNVKTLKSELDKITNKEEICYFVDVAKELKIEKITTLKALGEKLGTPYEILFDEDVE